MQLMILGMHRSGTSVMARLLNMMGAYFGPEGVSTGANRENPKGFWERQDVRWLNDFLLHAAGCDWNRVSGFSIDRIPQAAAADFRKRAARLILELDAHRPWILKEPRLCLLFPLWRNLLEVPVCIHVLRHPVEVASSLRSRNRIPIDAGLALWEKHVRSAFHAAAGLPQAVVRHHALLESPETELQTLLQQLQTQDVVGLRMPTSREVRAFIDPALHRERAAREDLREYLDAPQIELFERLASSGAGPEPISQELFPASAEALRAYEATMEAEGGTTSGVTPPPPVASAGGLANRDQTIEWLQMQNQALLASIDALQVTISTLSERLQDRESGLRELKQRLERDTELARHALEASEQALERSRQREAALDQRLRERLAEIERLTEVVLRLERLTSAAGPTPAATPE